MMPVPSLPDFGTRDERIRRQTYSPVRRKQGLPEPLFWEYWRNVHAPLCARLPGLGFYVQHHFSREHTANLWPRIEGIAPMPVVLDGAVELGFANSDDEADFVRESPVLFGDELNLFEHDNAYSIPGGSKTYVDRQSDGVPHGPDRLHRLHLHLSGGPGEDFKAWARGFASELASASVVWKLRLHLPEPYDNDKPLPPSPGVDHFLTAERKSIAAMEIGFESAVQAREWFETDLFKSTVPGQRKHLRAIGVFHVTGVYTFVRDGQPTTAGLRGSRQADIIEAVGAANQVRPEVSRLFVSRSARDRSSASND